MNCPVCKETRLVMSERQGIEIDYCPTCRGVWLDRGELDKIIERSAGEQAPQLQRSVDSRRDDDYYKHQYKKKKHEGFLGDLFDF
jgi:uncharacterized protein